MGWHGGDSPENVGWRCLDEEPHPLENVRVSGSDFHEKDHFRERNGSKD